MRRTALFSIVLFTVLFSTCAVMATPPRVESVQVRTRAPENRVVTVYFRIPANYDARRPFSWRVLVVFGGRNSNGRAEASGWLGWGDWADQYGVFIVSPGLNPEIVRYCIEKKVPVVPGCANASDIEAALSCGLQQILRLENNF